MAKNIRFTRGDELCRIFGSAVLGIGGVSNLTSNLYTEGYTFPSSGPTSGQKLRLLKIEMPNAWDRLNICLELFDREQMRGWYTLYISMLNTTTTDISLRLAAKKDIMNSDYLVPRLLKMNNSTYILEVSNGPSSYCIPVIKFNTVSLSSSAIKVSILTDSAWTSRDGGDYSSSTNFISI